MGSISVPWRNMMNIFGGMLDVPTPPPTNQEICVSCRDLLPFTRNLDVNDDARWANGALYMGAQNPFGELACGQYCMSCGSAWRRANRSALFGNIDEHGKF